MKITLLEVIITRGSTVWCSEVLICKCLQNYFQPQVVSSCFIFIVEVLVGLLDDAGCVGRACEVARQVQAHLTVGTCSTASLMKSGKETCADILKSNYHLLRLYQSISSSSSLLKKMCFTLTVNVI